MAENSSMCVFGRAAKGKQGKEWKHNDYYNQRASLTMERFDWNGEDAAAATSEGERIKRRMRWM